MLKKYGLGLLIAVIVIQLCVPVYMIVNVFAASYQAEKYGTEYKIPLDHIAVDEESGFLYFSVRYYADESYYNYMHEPYTSLTEGEDGFAVVKPVYDKPAHSSYIKNKKDGYAYIFPADRISVGKPKYTDALWLLDEFNEDDDQWYSGTIVYYSEAYLQAYVYNGKISVKNVYIDGIPANQFIAQYDVPAQVTQPYSEP